MSERGPGTEEPHSADEGATPDPQPVEKDRFDVKRCLGAGGMGVVYLAYDREREARVALKTLLQMSPTGLYRFKREFRALVNVTHPNLVALFELLSIDDSWFFTMEFVEGVDFFTHVRPPSTPAERPQRRLEQLTATETTAVRSDWPTAHVSDVLPPPTIRFEREVHPLAEDRLRSALKQLADGVHTLHQAGKLHCDLKPSNAMVATDGRVVILDFGLVAEVDRGLASDTPRAAFGTAAYMAPEQAAAVALTPAADWYAVGVVLYESLTGVLPFAGPTGQMLRRKQTREPPRPSSVVPDLPEDLDDLCVELLQREPRARPTGEEILRRLHTSADTAAYPARVVSPAASPMLDEPFVGRDRHMAALRDGYTKMTGGRAECIYVHGTSGMGKSVLIEHFLGALPDRDRAAVLRGRCYEQESVPYKALDSLVDDLSAYLARLSRNEVEALMPRDIRALVRLFPVLLRVEAIAAAPGRAVEMPDQREVRRRASAALRELLARLGDRTPLVLFIDDLQWGDVDSAALISDLLRPPDPPALFLLGSYRSEYTETSPCLMALLATKAERTPEYERHELAVEPLSPDSALELALILLQRRNGEDQARAAAIAEESGGNPYFIYQLAASEEARETDSEKIVLDEVVWRRVQRLPEAERLFLETVAVAGKPLRRAEAYAAAELPPQDEKTLLFLRNNNLVRTTGPRREDEVEVYHDRIRESIVGRLSPDLLVGKHRCLALTLEASGHADPQTLAAHFQGAGENDKAGGYYAVAADQAAETLAFHNAAKLYRLSLETRAVEGAEQRSLRTRLAAALANAGRSAEASDEYVSAAGIGGGDKREVLELRRLAAGYYLMSGHVDQGMSILARVLDEAGFRLPRTPRGALFLLVLNRVIIMLRGLGFRERDPDRIPTRELTRIDVSWSAARGLTTVDSMRGYYFLARSVLLSLRSGDPYRITRALASEATVVSVVKPGDARIRRLLERSQELADRLNDPYLNAMVMLQTGLVAYFEGEYDDSAKLLDQANEALRDRCTGVAWELDLAHNFAMWSLEFLGQWSEISRRLPVLVEDACERGDLYGMTMLNTIVGPLVRLIEGDPEEARRGLRATLEQWSRRGYHVQHANALYCEWLIDLYRGDGVAGWERATTLWSSAKRSLLLRGVHSRMKLGYARACCALQAVRQGSDARALLAEVEHEAKWHERCKLPPAWPRAHVLRAGLAAARGDRQGADSHLVAALRGFDSGNMGMFAAAVRRRRGELIGGDTGRTLIEQAGTAMKQQSVTDTAAMTRVLVPQLVSGG